MSINQVLLSYTFGQWVTITNELVTTTNAQLDSAVLANLTTTSKATLVGAINELDTDKLDKSGGTITGSLGVNGTAQFDDVVSIGLNGSGDSIINFYDDNNNVSRRLAWDSSEGYFIAEDTNNVDQKILTTGQTIDLGDFGSTSTNIQIKFKNGTATENDAYTGEDGELTVDVTNQNLRYHDGATLGGIAIGGSSASVGDIKYSLLREDHDGWLLQDGRQVSKTTYADLYGVFGANKFGTDTATLFTLADGRARGIIGENNENLPNGRNFSFSERTSGNKGGSETVTLTEDQSVIKQLFVDSANAGSKGSASFTDQAVPLNGTSTNAFGFGLAGSGSYQRWALKYLTNSADAHDNMSPYIVMGNMFVYSGVS